MKADTIGADSEVSPRMNLFPTFQNTRLIALALVLNNPQAVQTRHSGKPFCRENNRITGAAIRTQGVIRRGSGISIIKGVTPAWASGTSLAASPVPAQSRGRSDIEDIIALELGALQQHRYLECAGGIIPLYARQAHRARACERDRR
jgi:hypothetical protein